MQTGSHPTSSSTKGGISLNPEGLLTSMPHSADERNGAQVAEQKDVWKHAIAAAKAEDAA